MHKRAGVQVIIYLPCNLGEQFTSQRFLGWKDGKRVYTDGSVCTLRGFNAFDFQTRALSIPVIFTDLGFVLYDPSGEFPQEFIPKYKISVDVESEYKLSDKGFPSSKTAHLCGLVKDDECLIADFVAGDRYEHLRYVVKDNVKYVGLDEELNETLIEYCSESKRKEREEE